MDIERRAGEYRDFLLCGRDLAECEPYLAEHSRLVIVDIPRLIESLREARGS